MAKKELHPSIQQFKEFVKKHPKLIQEVRKGNHTWQEFYEEWYLLGEDDPRWDDYKEKGSNSKNSTGIKLEQVMEYMKKVDLQQVQGHIMNINQALGAISGVISQLQGGARGNKPQKEKSTVTSHPFPFRED